MTLTSFTPRRQRPFQPRVVCACTTQIISAARFSVDLTYLNHRAAQNSTFTVLLGHGGEEVPPPARPQPTGMMIVCAVGGGSSSAAAWRYLHNRCFGSKPAAHPDCHPLSKCQEPSLGSGSLSGGGQRSAAGLEPQRLRRSHLHSN